MQSKMVNWNIHLNYIDLMSKIAAIEYQRLPTKVDKADFEKLENSMREKIVLLERQLLKFRVDLQNISTLHERVTKEIVKEKQRDVNTDKDEVSLIKKPLIGFK